MSATDDISNGPVTDRSRVLDRTPRPSVPGSHHQCQPIVHLDDDRLVVHDWILDDTVLALDFSGQVILMWPWDFTECVHSAGDYDRGTMFDDVRFPIDRRLRIRDGQGCTVELSLTVEIALVPDLGMAVDGWLVHQVQDL